MCQADGTWSGAMPSCEGQTHSDNLQFREGRDEEESECSLYSETLYRLQWYTLLSIQGEGSLYKELLYRLRNLGYIACIAVSDTDRFGIVLMWDS